MNIEKRDILYRHRRLRKTDNMRRLVQENHLHLDDLIAPVFVIEGKNIQNSIPSMPGIFQWSLDKISGEIDNLLDLWPYHKIKITKDQALTWTLALFKKQSES